MVRWTVASDHHAAVLSAQTWSTPASDTSSVCVWSPPAATCADASSHACPPAAAGRKAQRSTALPAATFIVTLRAPPASSQRTYAARARHIMRAAFRAEPMRATLAGAIDKQAHRVLLPAVGDLELSAVARRARGRLRAPRAAYDGAASSWAPP